MCSGFILTRILNSTIKIPFLILLGSDSQTFILHVPPWRNVHAWCTPYFLNCKNHKYKNRNKENSDRMHINITLILNLMCNRQKLFNVTDKLLCPYIFFAYLVLFFWSRVVSHLQHLKCFRILLFLKQSIWKTLCIDSFSCPTLNFDCEHRLIMYLQGIIYN